MNLADIVAKYPGSRQAGPEDNQAILEFFDQSPMQGERLQLRYERAPDFFRFLRYQSDTPFVFVGEREKDGGIGGVGTLALRPGYIKGQRTTVGYLGDLRVGFDRRIIRQWRAGYAELMQHSATLPEVHHCTHFITAVIDENRIAQKALISSQKAGFAYVELAKYRMVNVLGRLPWAGASRRQRQGLIARRATEADREKLRAFFGAQNRPRAFGFVEEELDRRLEAWDDFSIGSFFLAETSSGEIVGCFAPWSPAKAKRIVVERMPFAMKALCAATKLVRGKAPGEGRELEVLYLTHLEVASEMPQAERDRVFAVLLDALYEDGWPGRYHMLAFCDFERGSFGNVIRPYVTQSVPMKLYRVLHKSQLEAEAHADLGTLPPAFEMALV